MRNLILMLLCLLTPAWAATTATNFTSVANGPTLQILPPLPNEPMQTGTYALTGTWAGTMVWQISQDASNWTTLKTYTANQAAIVFSQPGYYRLGCTAYTSGTVVGTVVINPFIYQQVSSNSGNVLFQIDDSGVTSVSASPQIIPSGNQEASFYQGNVNNFFELQVQNLNAGSSASSDFVATANDGSATTHYVDLGINGSTGGIAPFTAAHGAYVYSSDNLLDVGAVGATGTVNIDVGATPTVVLNVDYANGVSINDVTDPTKQLRFLPSGQTTATILTLNTGAQTVSRTLSIPILGGADTIDTLATAQTVSGIKTFSAIPVFNVGITAKTPIALEDVTDPTKQVLWSISPATTATNLTIADNQSTSQTLNVPNITATDTIVTTGLTQTISGAKTLSAITNVSNATSASSAITGGLTVGNGTAATNTGIGGGNINTGGTITTGGNISTSQSATSTWTNGTSSGAATMLLNAGTGANPIVKYQVAGSNVFEIYAGSTGTLLMTDMVDSTNPFVYTPGAIGAGYITYANTLAGGSSGTGSAVYAGGIYVSKASYLVGVQTIGAATVPSANTFAGNIIWGRNTAAADTAGAVGETITGAFSAVAAAATTVTGNVGSVSLTAGKWLVSGKVVIHSGATGLTSGTTIQCSCPVGTAATGTSGTTMSQQSVLDTLTATQLFAMSVDAQVVNISATTSEYLTVNITYGGGSPTIDGSITALRLP